IGNDREVERSPAVSLWLARWAKPVTLDPFRMTVEQTPDGASLLGWPDALAAADRDRSALLLLADPFTFPADAFLAEANANYRGLRVLGGMASGVRGPGQCRLLLDDAVHDHGAVGVLLQGSLGLRAIVSQGCRPIGRHMVITKAEDNIIAG